MAERYTTENLPEDADERVAEYCEPKPSIEGFDRMDEGTASRDDFWYVACSDDGESMYWRPAYHFAEDLGAWPEVHKALERGLWREWVYALSRVINVESTDVDLWEFRRVTATPEQRTAALLNMEARGE